VSEISAQNTPQIIYCSLSNLPLLGCEQKRFVFECVPLNANVLLLPATVQKMADFRIKHANSLSSKIPEITSLVQPYRETLEEVVTCRHTRTFLNG